MTGSGVWGGRALTNNNDCDTFQNRWIDQAPLDSFTQRKYSNCRNGLSVFHFPPEGRMVMEERKKLRGI